MSARNTASELYHYKYLYILTCTVGGNVAESQTVSLTQDHLFSFDKIIAWFCLNVIFHELQGADHITIIKLASSVNVIRTTELYVGPLVIFLPGTCFVASENLLWLEFLSSSVCYTRRLVLSQHIVCVTACACVSVSPELCVWDVRSIFNATGLHRMAQPTSPVQPLLTVKHWHQQLLVLLSPSLNWFLNAVHKELLHSTAC